MEHMTKTSGDVSKVVLDQPEEEAGALGDTGPYHGARPRTTEVDRPVDEGLGATLGGLEENVNFRDILVPRLPPEQQLRQEEVVQTSPRREPRRNEGHQPRGPRVMTDGTVLAPGGLADQRMDTAGRNRQNDEWSPVAALENTVTYAARSRGPANRKPIF